MPRRPRFFMPQIEEGECRLEGTEAHHLMNVLRLRVGHEAELFDGQGRSAAAEITAVARSSATLIAGPLQTDPEATGGPLALAVALPRPERARWLVEKATELGVDAIVPLTTRFSTTSGRSVNITKLKRYVVDACKQCGRNRLLLIREPVELPEFLSEIPDAKKLELYFGELGGATAPEVTGAPRCVVIGPEGGFSDGETQGLRDCGAIGISLGPHILRVETAAVAAAVRFSTR